MSTASDRATVSNEQRLLAQYRVARALAESASVREAAPLILRAIGESLGWELGGCGSSRRRPVR